MNAIMSPFTARCHPLQRRLREATAGWLPALPACSALTSHRYDQVHARMWPDASWERLWLANRLLLHMWWIDDILDDPGRHDALDLARAHHDVLSSGSRGDDSDGSAVLAGLLAEAAHLMPPRWNHRIRQQYENYLTSSIVHRDRFGVVPTLATT